MHNFLTPDPNLSQDDETTSWAQFGQISQPSGEIPPFLSVGYLSSQ